MKNVRFSIMALAPQVWDEQWVNRQQLLSRVGREHVVLYSTGGWFVWDRSSEAWRKGLLFGSIRASDNVWIDDSPRYLMRWPRLATLDQTIMRAQVHRWRAWLRQQGDLPVIAHLCHPKYLPYADLLCAKRVVYHVYDRYELMPDWSGEWDRNERRLLERADLVFCASQMMADALYAKVQRHIEILPNGADTEMFFRAAVSASNVPQDLALIPRPRIGWTGSIHPEIDYPLIEALARRMPDRHFVFVGNKVRFSDEAVERQYLDCQAMPNIHFLGFKDHRDVPSYVVNMDVNMMCYRTSTTTWIKSGSPLKLHEYLAAGHPVVSARLPAIEPFSHVVRIADGVEDWQMAIEDALGNRGPGTAEERKTIAAQNSWDSRARDLNRWLIELAD